VTDKRAAKRFSVRRMDRFHGHYSYAVFDGDQLYVECGANEAKAIEIASAAEQRDKLVEALRETLGAIKQWQDHIVGWPTPENKLIIARAESILKLVSEGEEKVGLKSPATP
jgi:hypothetical protein